MKARQAIQSKAAGGFYTAAVLILMVRICSYFMLSDDVAVTQAFKVCMRIMVTAFSGMLLLRMTNRFQQRAGFEQPAALLIYIAYLTLGVLSLSWTSSFSDSLLHLLMDLETLVFCYLYIKLLIEARSAYDGKVRISKITAISIFIITAGFLIGRIINPGQFFRFTHGGEEARLGGFIINPNELGMLLVIGIATTFLELKHSFNKWVKWMMMLIMLYALVLTASRSSMIALLLILLFFASQSKTMRMRLLIVTTLLASAPVIVHQVFIKQGNVEEVLSMTGRIPFWKDLLTINFQKEPILGYGYMRIDYSDKFESINSYAGAMTHNTFLQVLMGLGLTGLFIVLMQYAATLHGVSACRDAKLKRLAIAILIPVTINSFTEFGIFGETNYGIMFYLFIVFSVALKPGGEILRKKAIHAESTGALFRPSPAA